MTISIAQPFKATDNFILDCGSSSTTTCDRKWEGDYHSEFVPSNTTTTSFSSTPHYLDPSVPGTPYLTARVFNSSSFTYTFPVSEGPKFLRLYFYPATYSGLNANQSFFSVSSNGYSLLTNFSAFLTASFLVQSGSTQIPYFVKEFLIHVNNTQNLNVMFTPSPNSYAFINGIEVVSMPENLYINAKTPKYVNQLTGPVIDNGMALENIYRLNMGGGQVTADEDTGMYRSWYQDNNYIFGAAFGWTFVYSNPIMFTTETPNYTAPEIVYQTQRSMDNMADMYNLTWILPVDSGFYYMLRLHFCNIIPQYTGKNNVVFRIFINNQTVEQEADLFYWTQGSGYPIFKDYIVFVNDPDGRRSKQDLWVAMHPNPKFKSKYHNAYLNGLEVFKLSMSGDLSSPSPELSPEHPPPRPVSAIKGNKKTPPYAAIFGGVSGCFVLLSVLLLVVLVRKKRANPCSTTDDVKLPSDRCRRFTLQEVKTATNEFNDNCSIGSGGFGKVYKGYVDNTTTIVAIQRLNPSSSQGFHEFRTEIALLSRLRHVHLVSMIGYCEDKGEMVLVYDYMGHGTLREHLYNTNKPPLSWKRRLHICIGAAKGLHYLHSGGNRAIIHRDVKSTNILLDDNWVPKVASSCLHDEESERRAMEEVVWGLEFALELQEAAEKQDGHDETMPENQ
ncbi:hypothetical protein L1987_46820 [Smallanthus sonchifolius]|uniref:Uncharacterized protein n=1 Tax=Smallanthus sonchifolius TaxID=185202 RepID=A0ACB9G2L1_9ASTR|nr:hypothetical protein L1987_46820 [Smallanthus sonchifolius]